MHSSDFELWNRAAFLLLNAGAGVATWRLAAAQFLADDVIYAVPLLLTAMWLWGDCRLRRAAVRACVVAAVALGMGQLIGIAWPHPRPFVVGLGHTWVAHAADASFPSDHVTVFSAVGMSLLFDGQVLLALPVLVLGMVVGWARVYLGVHFPFDIVGAAALAGLTWALLAPVWRRVGIPITDALQHVYRKAMALPIARGWLRA